MHQDSISHVNPCVFLNRCNRYVTFSGFVITVIETERSEWGQSFVCLIERVCMQLLE